MVQLRAGAARADMTPEPGIAMAGGWRPQPARAIETPLAAHALILGNGLQRLAVVSLDVCLLPGGPVEAAKRRIRVATGIPPEHVLIACSHTHEAPYTCSLLGPDTGPDPVFMARLGDAVVAAVGRASAALAPAELACATAPVPGLCANRRRYKTPGDVYNTWMLPRDEAEAHPPAGPVDDEVILLAVRRPDGTPVAALWNFSLHAHAFWKQAICADYPYYVGRRLAEALGADPVSVFTAGACGDVNRAADAAPERIVDRLAEALEGLWRGARFRPEAYLEAALQPVALPLRDFTVFQEEEIRRKLPSVLEVCRAEWQHLRGMEQRSERTVLQVMRLGDLALAAVPGELFCALGLEIKRRSPFRPTGVVELANDYVGYIPTEAAFDEGGYELFNLRSSKVARGAGEQIVHTVLDMLAGLGKGTR